MGEESSLRLRASGDLSILQVIADSMVPIRAGSISLHDPAFTQKPRYSTTRGTPREQWTVELAPFLLSKVAVTVDVWRAFVDDTTDGIDGALPKALVSWEDAVAFCNHVSAAAGLAPCYRVDGADDEGDGDGDLVVVDEAAGGYRLPSEAEWEFACRAGSVDRRAADLDAVAWYENNADERPHPVGTKDANLWGLHDMLGNVWEWCSDLYDPAVYGRYRVFRGGGFADDAEACRPSCRRKSHPRYRADDLGFRLARTP